VHYPGPIHREPALCSDDVILPKGGLSVTEQQAEETLSLLLHPSLTDDQISFVADEIERFFAN